MHHDYFQGTLQLRNHPREVEEYLLKALEHDVSRIEKVRNGIDIYFKDKRRARRIVKEARDKFGGHFEINSTLHTRNHQTSKDVHRDTLLLKFPGFAIGDVIVTDGKLIRVTGMGKKVSGDDLRKGKKTVFDYPDDAEVLEKHKTRVVKIKPEVQVLHPETFQPEPLQNEPGRLEVNQKVKVVEKKGLWLV